MVLVGVLQSALFQLLWTTASCMPAMCTGRFGLLLILQRLLYILSINLRRSSIIVADIAARELRKGLKEEVGRPTHRPFCLGILLPLTQ